MTVLELTSADSTAQKVEVADLGAAVEITGRAAGAFTLDVDGDSETGTIAIDGDDVTITVGGDPATGTIDQNGDTATINLDAGVSFDFDEDGSDEAATRRLVMTRQT